MSNSPPTEQTKPTRRRFFLWFVPLVALGGLLAVRQRQRDRDRRRRLEEERKKSRARRRNESPEEVDDE